MHDAVSEAVIDSRPDEVFSQRVELGDHVDQSDVKKHPGRDGENPRIGVGVFADGNSNAQTQKSGRRGQAIAEQSLGRKESRRRKRRRRRKA